jgi:UDP-N-acetylglucosamine 2-epimerase (non-hydrolysing)
MTPDRGPPEMSGAIDSPRYADIGGVPPLPVIILGVAANPLVAVLLGTRPEAVKLAPVILKARAAGLQLAVIGTGQHRELVDQVLGLFGIELDEDLELMKPGQSLDHVLTRTVEGTGELFDEYQPGVVVVQGDTTSAFGAALAAFHRGIPVAHVEAGLRSHDLGFPFPEEMNRRGISLVTSYHFAPTATAAANLEREGITSGITVTGNTVVDAMRHVLAMRPPIPPEISEALGDGPFILATAHRRESWLGGIGRIAAALRDVVDALPDHRLVFVTHPNPVARAPVQAILGDHPKVILPGALAYPAFLALLSSADVVVSDSGGIQEEGPTLGIPVVVTRDRTEREEGLHAGAVVLVGTDRDLIRKETLLILTDPLRRERMATAGLTLYGDGRAADRIVASLGAATSGS